MSLNGQVAADSLVGAQSGISLSLPTAAAYSAMRSACLNATGVSLRIASPYGGYRSLADQQAMWDNRASYLPIVIAYPGSSTHGFGTALDLTTASRLAAKQWLADNAPRFGFKTPPSNDPNHYAFTGLADTSTATRQETFMKLVNYTAPGGITNLLVTDNGAYALTQPYADAVYRFLTLASPAAEDINLTLAIIYGQRWSPSTGTVPSILTTSGGTGGLTPAQDAALMGLPAAIDGLPTNGELGTALTNTVNLVNQHADVNKDAVISKVNGLTLTHN